MIIERRPGDKVRSDLRTVRIMCLKIMAEADTWYELMLAHNALFHADIKSKGLIEEAERDWSNNNSSCEQETSGASSKLKEEAP